MRAAIILALCLLTGTLASMARAAEVTRPEYVSQLEKICRPGSEATQRAVHGMRSDIRSERLQLAGDQVRQGEANLLRHGQLDLEGATTRRRPNHPRRAGSPPWDVRPTTSDAPPPPCGPKTSRASSASRGASSRKAARPTTSSSRSASTTATSSPRDTNESPARLQAPPRRGIRAARHLDRSGARRADRHPRCRRLLRRQGLPSSTSSPAPRARHPRTQRLRPGHGRRRAPAAGPDRPRLRRPRPPRHGGAARLPPRSSA